MKKVFILLLIIPLFAAAQELNCKVTVNTDNITSSDKSKLDGFQQAVSDYLNKTSFTDSWSGYKITCSMDILILTVSGDNSFTAQTVITSQRPIYKSTDNSLVLKINDNNWSFTYNKGQSFYYNQNTFNSLTSFLDYYADIIIGFDMDTWERMGGTKYFNKAYNIVTLASSGSNATGWAAQGGNSYSRGGLVSDLLDEKYKPFRESIYDYYFGIDIYPQNKTIGQQKIVSLINTLNQMRDKIDINGPLMNVFFDAKSGEIADRLATYPDKGIFYILKRVDPAHIAKYNEVAGD